MGIGLLHIPPGIEKCTMYMYRTFYLITFFMTVDCSCAVPSLVLGSGGWVLVGLITALVPAVVSADFSCPCPVYWPICSSPLVLGSGSWALVKLITALAPAVVSAGFSCLARYVDPSVVMTTVAPRCRKGATRQLVVVRTRSNDDASV